MYTPHFTRFWELLFNGWEFNCGNMFTYLAQLEYEQQKNASILFYFEIYIYISHLGEFAAP